MLALLRDTDDRRVHTTRDVQPWPDAWSGDPPPLVFYDHKLFADTGKYEDVAGQNFRLYRVVPDLGGPLT